MKDYGEFKLFTTMKEINELKTVEPPTADTIRCHEYNSHCTKGFTAVIYDRKRAGFEFLAPRENEADLIESIRIRKNACEKFPEVFGNWVTEMSDIFIFETYGHYKPNWGLRGILIED